VVGALARLGKKSFDDRFLGGAVRSGELMEILNVAVHAILVSPPRGEGREGFETPIS
jgi:hypothetical protein